MKTKTRQTKKGHRTQPSPRKREDRSLNSEEQNRITNASADEDADDNQIPEYSSDRTNRDDEDQARRKRRQEEEVEDEEN